MVKHRSLMYNKNVKKTFEILRSEITILMDLYMIKHYPVPTAISGDPYSTLD